MFLAADEHVFMKRDVLLAIGYQFYKEKTINLFVNIKDHEFFEPDIDIFNKYETSVIEIYEVIDLLGFQKTFYRIWFKDEDEFLIWKLNQ